MFKGVKEPTTDFLIEKKDLRKITKYFRVPSSLM